MPLLTSAAERAEIIREYYGIGTVFVEPFDRAMMTMPWEAYLEMLIGTYGAVHFVAGHDHRFGHKNAVWANVQGIRQDISQGHHNDDFTQYGEKDGIFLLVEGFENCLAHILQQHEDKCSKIKFHGGDGIGHQGLIRAENADQEARCSQNHTPDEQRIDQC